MASVPMSGARGLDGPVRSRPGRLERGIVQVSRRFVHTNSLEEQQTQGHLRWLAKAPRGAMRSLISSMVHTHLWPLSTALEHLRVGIRRIHRAARQTWKPKPCQRPCLLRHAGAPAALLLTRASLWRTLSPTVAASSYGFANLSS